MTKQYRKKMMKFLGYIPPRLAFLTRTTCPICNQKKPIDLWTIREMLHFQRHAARKAFA